MTSEPYILLPLLRGNGAISMHSLHLLCFFTCFIFFNVLYRDTSQMMSAAGNGAMQSNVKTETIWEEGRRVSKMPPNLLTSCFDGPQYGMSEWM